MSTGLARPRHGIFCIHAGLQVGGAFATTDATVVSPSPDRLQVPAASPRIRDASAIAGNASRTSR